MPILTVAPRKLLLITLVTTMLQTNSESTLTTKATASTPPQLSLTISDVASLKQLFPTSLAEIQALIELAKAWTMQAQTIINLAPAEQSFDTTFRLLDRIHHEVSCCLGVLAVIENAHPDATLRQGAHQGLQTVQDLFTEQVELNKTLYEALKIDAKRWINPNYLNNVLPTESLTAEELYFVTETLEGFRRAGLHLDPANFQRVQTLIKELNRLSLQFQQNINTDQSFITVDAAELAGVPAQVVANLERTPAGQLVVKTDYPTVLAILDFCENTETRHRVSRMFNNRAYPQNNAVLTEIINKRDELAQLIGFPSYAAMDLDNQMAKELAMVEQFIQGLQAKACGKAQQEVQQFLAAYPKPQSLTNEQGQVYAWNMRFLKNYYKKQQLNLDMRMVAEYFPLDHTIQELLQIYEQFLGLQFKHQKIDLWVPDLELLAVYRAEQLLGYIILDLHPRANKFSHAASFSAIHTVLTPQGSTLAVDVVMTNFPAGTAEIPALMNFSDVTTFFHEFGHALHTVLGATNIASFSGTNVKRDFVEMPSQMLENWLQDPAILRQVSCHYQTGAPLPDEMIKTLTEINKFDAGDFIARQLLLTKFSLELFKPGKNKAVNALYRVLAQQYHPYLALDSEDHFYAAFGHLTGYGAKYYGYLWANVFAKDLFNKIKAGGLLNPAVGQEYVAQILSKGGTQDPNQLIENFLGRKPTQTAFLQAMGLE